jgi:hypothetical protein
MEILVALTRGIEEGENRRLGDGGWSRGRAQPTWCGDDTSGEDGLADEELAGPCTCEPMIRSNGLSFIKHSG